MPHILTSSFSFSLSLPTHLPTYLFSPEGLHISVSEHKSNEILNTLTFISAIFLPLTFLCGVYGMIERVREREGR